MVAAGTDLDAHSVPGGHDDAERAVLGRVEFEVAQLLRRADRPVPRTGQLAGAGRDTTDHDDGLPLDRSAYLLLAHLATHGAENVNALADELRLDSSTVTRQVQTLAAAGLVLRGRDPHDGRAVLVEPTEAGLDRLRRNRELRADYYAHALADWSRLDRALLGELLSRLNTSLDDYRRRTLAAEQR